MLSSPPITVSGALMFLAAFSALILTVRWLPLIILECHRRS